MTLSGPEELKQGLLSTIATLEQTSGVAVDDPAFTVLKEIILSRIAALELAAAAEANKGSAAEPMEMSEAAPKKKVPPGAAA